VATEDAATTEDAAATEAALRVKVFAEGHQEAEDRVADHPVVGMVAPEGPRLEIPTVADRPEADIAPPVRHPAEATRNRRPTAGCSGTSRC